MTLLIATCMPISSNVFYRVISLSYPNNSKSNISHRNKCFFAKMQKKTAATSNKWQKCKKQFQRFSRYLAVFEKKISL